MGGEVRRSDSDRDRDTAELLGSSSVQNAVAAGGVLALLMVPLAAVLERVRSLVAGRRRAGRTD